MTLGSLIEACAHRTGFSDSAYRPRWISFINEAIREFSRKQPWEGLEDYVTLKTDGTKYLILPHYVDTVVSLLDLTNSCPVERAGDFEVTDPAVWAQQTSGRPYKYTKAGDVPTLTDPTGYLWLQSTHASDVNTIYVTGLVSNSGASGAMERTFKELSLSATGVTPVTLSTQFVKIFSISKATDTNGDFFIYDAGASNAHIAFLSKTDQASSFKRLALLFKPAVATSLELRFRYRIPQLRQDAQAPHPSVKSDFIVRHAIAIHWEEQEQMQKAQISENKANRVLADETNKELNFNEPHNQMLPNLPDGLDASDDYFRMY